MREGNTSSSAKTPVRESLVTRIWLEQLFQKKRLLTAAGKRIRVLHPGRQSSDCGPDVSDAIIAFGDGQPVRGDIEIHVTSSEWKAHGHHRDPNFNRVILHVVLRHRGPLYSTTNDGREVPILSLSNYLKTPLAQLCRQTEASLSRERPCRAAARGRERSSTLAILEVGGEQRFVSKAEQFKSRLANCQANQVLYEGIMKALGYARNEVPFIRLSRLLPIERLQYLAFTGQVTVIQAMVLGTAGLLPTTEREDTHNTFSHRDLREISRLKAHWKDMDIGETMCRTDWKFFRIRPGNLPPRRIAGISHLLVRHSGDLSQHVLRTTTAPTLRQARKMLTEGLIVRTSDYWAGHGDFGVDVPLRGAVIGRERAADIAVNIVLPFLLAYGDIHSQPHLQQRAWKLYRTHKKLQENRITRYMARQIFGNDSTVESACQQQGLIHFYCQFCMGNKCTICPLA